MGYSPRAEIFDVKSSIPTVALRLRDWKRAREEAQKLMIKAQKKWTKRKELMQRYKAGDHVWLDGRNLRIDWPSVKLTLKRYRPFKIGKVLLPIMYQLELPLQWKIHDVFHVDLLTPYHETELHGPNFTRPPPNLINGEEEYKVEEILQSWKSGRGRKVQYLVKWKGYPKSENQWVDWNDLHADEAIADFKKKNPKVMSHIKAEGDEANLNNSLTLMSNDDHSSASLATISGADMPPEVQECYIWTSLHTQIHRTALFLSPFSLPHIEAHVQYDLASQLCMIQSCASRYDLAPCWTTIRSLNAFLYDINLGATATTTLSIRGVQISIDLVSSAMDSSR